MDMPRYREWRKAVVRKLQEDRGMLVLLSPRRNDHSPATQAGQKRNTSSISVHASTSTSPMIPSGMRTGASSPLFTPSSPRTSRATLSLQNTPLYSISSIDSRTSLRRRPSSELSASSLPSPQSPTALPSLSRRNSVMLSPIPSSPGYSPGPPFSPFSSFSVTRIS